MSDELERLKLAMRDNIPEPPPEARRRAIAASMAAFDQHSESVFDGEAEGKGAEKGPGSWLIRFMGPSSRTGWAFGGAVSFALVAVIAIYLVPSDPSPPVGAPGPAGAPRMEYMGPTGIDADFEHPEGRSVVENEWHPKILPTDGQAFDGSLESQRREPPVDAGDKSTAGSREQRSSDPEPHSSEAPMIWPDGPSTDVIDGFTVPSVRPLYPSTQVRSLGPSSAAEHAPVSEYRDQGRDRFTPFDPNPVKVTAEEPVSTFSIDVDTAAYGFVRASLHDGVLPQKNAVRIEELINYFPYDYPSPENAETPFAASVALLPSPWKPVNRLLHIGIQGYSLKRDETRSANLVFLVDTSGSMNASNKLPLVKRSFKLLLGALAPRDRVAIVTYAGTAGIVLEPTLVSEAGRIEAALEGLHAEGSTAGGEGIRQAYLLAEQHFVREGINRVILATDGDFNVGITDPEELLSYIERKRASGVWLSVLGFGMGNYNDALMQRLAQNGNGNALYIDTLSAARKALVDEATSMLFPIAKDVKIQVEFNPAVIGEYRLIGYEMRLLAREDFRNDKVDAGEVGAGQAVTAIYELTPVDSGAELVAPRRYGRDEASAGDALKDELAFLKIRYKLPQGDTSKLIERPVTSKDLHGSVDAAAADARFAVAVAAFGQLLHGGRHTGDYGYADVIALAQGAKGDDPYGYRAEFIDLVRLAESASAMAPLQR